MQRQPVVFLIVFQLGWRDLGAGILLLLLRSIAPLSRIQRSLSSYSLLLWKTKMRKDTNLQKKVYCNSQYFPGATSAKNRPRQIGPERVSNQSGNRLYPRPFDVSSGYQC